MKTNCIRRKRAFTLTELLIVVIVIGVLSAVTLPKFNRVIENRKVTEAEEMMSAVRMEQERRCSLDQNYTTNFSSLSDVIASANTKNYTYSLQSQGISAKSASGDYTLKILSYEDGSYCCTGAGCKKLNKNYPDCATLSFPASNCAGTEGGGEPGEPEDPEETPECADGQVQGSQACNGCGVQTTQKCVGGKWTNVLGTCSKTAEECAPKPQCPAKPADVTKNCECGTVTATHKCDASTNYEWVQEEFPACPVKPEDMTETCSDGKTVRTKTFTCVNNVWTAGEWDKECPSACPEGKEWDGNACVCANSDEKAACVDTKKTVRLPQYSESMGVSFQVKQYDVKYQWDEETCSCSCPEMDNLTNCPAASFSPFQFFIGSWDTASCSCQYSDDMLNWSGRYFKCVTRVVGAGGNMVTQDSYTTKEAAQQACLTGKDENAVFYEYISGGKPVDGCTPYKDEHGNLVQCEVTETYWIKWACSSEPPKHASGYGFDEVLCVVVQPHP